MLCGQHRHAATIIQLGGVTALVGLLNAGAHAAFLPTMRSLRQLSGALLPHLSFGKGLRAYE